MEFSTLKKEPWIIQMLNEFPGNNKFKQRSHPKIELFNIGLNKNRVRHQQLESFNRIFRKVYADE